MVTITGCLDIWRAPPASIALVRPFLNAWESLLESEDKTDWRVGFSRVCEHLTMLRGNGNFDLEIQRAGLHVQDDRTQLDRLRPRAKDKQCFYHLRASLIRINSSA